MIGPYLFRCPCSTVGIAQGLRTGGCWSVPGWANFFLRTGDSYCCRIYPSLTAADHCLGDTCAGEQPWVNPLPDDKILDWSKLKQIADENLKHI